MDTYETATAEGFAGQMRVVPRPPVEGDDSFALNIVVPASGDGTRWSVFSLEGEWEEVDGDRFLRPNQTAHDVAIGDGTVEGQGRIRNFARNTPSFNTVLHALGRCEHRLQEQDEDEVRILLDGWLGRPATDQERDLVGRRALAQSLDCPAGEELLSRTLLGIFDFATELDSHLVELVTGPGAEAARAACAAFPMLAAEIAASEEVVDGLLQEMSIDEALEAGAMGTVKGRGRSELPPLEPHTVAWFDGLRLKSAKWEPSMAPYAIRLANVLDPEILPREDAEFHAFLFMAEKGMASEHPDDDEWIDYAPWTVKLMERFGNGFPKGRRWTEMLKQWDRVVRRMRQSRG